MKPIFAILLSTLVWTAAQPAHAGISDEFYVEGVVVGIHPREIRVANSGTVMIVPKNLIPKDTRISANGPVSIPLAWEHANKIKTARTPASVSEAGARRPKPSF